MGVFGQIGSALDIDLGFPRELVRRPGHTSRVRRLAELRARTHFPPRSLSSTLSRSGRSRRAPRDTGGERSAYGREAGALSVSQRVHLFRPPPSSLAGGVTRSRDHWVRLDSRALAYVRSIDQSAGRFPPIGRHLADRRSHTRINATARIYTRIRTRSSHVSGFSSRLDISRGQLRESPRLTVRTVDGDAIRDGTGERDRESGIAARV